MKYVQRTFERTVLEVACFRKRNDSDVGQDKVSAENRQEADRGKSSSFVQLRQEWNKENDVRQRGGGGLYWLWGCTQVLQPPYRPITTPDGPNYAPLCRTALQYGIGKWGKHHSFTLYFNLFEILAGIVNSSPSPFSITAQEAKCLLLRGQLNPLISK